jgi:hypothetical protein
MLAVRFPMAAVRLCTTKRAKISVVALSLPVMAINVNMFFVYKYVEDQVSGNKTNYKLNFPISSVCTCSCPLFRTKKQIKCKAMEISSRSG